MPNGRTVHGRPHHDHGRVFQEEAGMVIIGIDPHGSKHVAAAIDEHGRAPPQSWQG